MAEPTVLAYLGPEASYTHQATLKLPLTPSTLVPYPTIKSIFSLIETQLAPQTAPQYGIVPLENSTNGPVSITLDLLADASLTHPSIRIISEVRVPVRHVLLGRSNTPTSQTPPHYPTDPLPPLTHLRSIHTHPQAWGQCTSFLRTLRSAVPEIRSVDSSSTSAAAAHVAEQNNPTAVAISSAVAARLTGLDVLMTGLEDVRGNVTRFVVISHEASPSFAAIARDGSVAVRASDRGRRKAAFKFTLPPSHVREPGALGAVLAVFAAQGLDLTSVNARPLGGWDYCFVVECVLPLLQSQSRSRSQSQSQQAGADDKVEMGKFDVESFVERLVGGLPRELLSDETKDRQDREGRCEEEVLRETLEGIREVARTASILGMWEYEEEDLETLT